MNRSAQKPGGRLCPCSSDVNLFSHGEGIIDLNAEIRLRMEIVKWSHDMRGFIVLPRRWVVERTFSRFGRTGVSPRISRLCRNRGHLRALASTILFRVR